MSETTMAFLNCPRCFGRVGLRVPMYETERARPPRSEAERAAAGGGRRLPDPDRPITRNG